jgi:hypothetical protein
MKITNTIISIPPYISTAWVEVVSIRMQGEKLIFSLKDGSQAEVPGLAQEVIDQIFASHAAFLETKNQTPIPQQQASEIFALPIKMGLGSLESMGQVLQHNPAYSGLPPMPHDMVQKITTLSKIISEEDLAAMPPPEENCNCMYCQIARILMKLEPHEQQTGTLEHHDKEESVSDAELHFEQWEVKLLQDKMYLVTNKLDREEHYSVHLGEPIGCTCGKPNCDHIIAVLRS